MRADCMLTAQVNAVLSEAADCAEHADAAHVTVRLHRVDTNSIPATCDAMK